MRIDLPYFHWSSKYGFSEGQPGTDFWQAFNHGITNTWYKLTGQSHLTDEVKHAEEREDTAMQRGAADTVAAGFSKYAASPASSSNSSNGMTMLDAIQQMQNIKANTLQLKEEKYNFNKSKQLGIRTSDTNELSKAASIIKLLLGYDIDDIQGGHGILGMLFPKLFGGSEGSGAITGAAADAVGALSTSPVTTSYGLSIPDTYDRSRIARQVASGQASLEDFTRAYEKVAVAGLNHIGDGQYQLNDYGRSVLKGVAKMTSTSAKDVMSSFQKFYWNWNERLKDNVDTKDKDPLPSQGFKVW